MKQRALSIICALTLVVAMLPPVTASAAAPSTLTVGGTTITSSGYWTTNADGTLTAEGASADNYNVYYDGDGTLTLKDATINGTNTIGHVGAGIYAEGDLTIVLEGSSTVTGVQDPNGDSQSIRVSENLTIQGGGSLTAQGANTTSDGSSYGIFVIGSFTQQSGSVTASGGNVSGNQTSTGLYVYGSTVTVQGGTLTATGGTTGSGSYGISMFSSVTVNDAIVTATGGTGKYSYGLHIQSSSPSVTISGSSSLTARSESADKAGGIYVRNLHGSAGSVTVGDNSTLLTNSVILYDQSYAEKPLAPTGDGSWLIYGQSGQTSAVGGTYTLEENITIPSGTVVTIPAGSTLNLGGHTLTVDGTLNIANQSSLAGEGTLAGDSGTYTMTNPDPVISGSDTLTYDGTDQFSKFKLEAPTGTVEVMGKNFTISDTPSLDGWNLGKQEIINAGTYTLTAKNSDGSRTVQKQVTVSKATSTIAFNNYALSYTYTGQPLANPTAEQLTLTGAGYDDVTFTWYEGTSPNGTKLDSAPTDAGTYYLVASIPDSNNTTASEATSGEITITKATATAAPGALSVSNNAAKTYTYDLSQLLPALDDGKTLGEVTYALGTVSLGSYYDSSSPATISGSTLTLPIQAVVSDTEGSIGTVTATISSDNYADMTATITVSSVNKQTQTVTISGQPGSVVYGDSFTLSASAPGSGAVSWSASGCASVDSNGKVTITGTGEFTITAAVAEDETYAAASNGVTMTAGKKALTITAKNQTVVQNQTMPELTYEVSGLVEGDTFTNPTITSTAKDTATPGKYDILISGGTLTNADYYDVSYVDGSLEVIKQSGGGSSSSGGGSSSSGNKTETTTNPDGSTTTTVTSSTGTVTETTKWPDGSKEVVETKKNGTVTTTTTDPAGNQTEVVENPDGSSKTTVDNKDGSGSVTLVDENGQMVSEATLSQFAVAAAQEKGEAVTLPMPEVPVTTDRETAPTVTVSLPSGTSAKVEIPVADVTPGTVAVIVKADGTEEVIKTSLTTENGVAVTLSDGDTVKVVDNSKTFDDVADNYWGAEAVDFAVSRELFAGTSATTFAPDTAMTRAMIVTVLARFEGVDTTTGSTWYEAGQQWAVQNGVSDGTNMDASLTREQLATMMWNYSGKPAASGLAGYTDADDVSDWASQAMAWCVEQGIIGGTTTITLSPQGPATRAQVATILMRFIEGMA